MNIPDTAHSEEIQYDKKFVSRWTDIVYDVRRKYGQEAANEFARRMFSPDIIRLINKEIEKREHGRKPAK